MNQRRKRSRSPHSSRRTKSARRLRNFLLLPRLQISLAVYMIALALGLLASLSLIIYLKMNDIAAIVVQLTDIEDEVRDVLMSYIGEMSFWLVLAIVLYIVANLALCIVFTHRLIGPSYAFRRQIRAMVHGDYQQRIRLRQGDAFGEIADELNLLAQTLEGAARKRT